MKPTEVMLGDWLADDFTLSPFKVDLRALTDMCMFNRPNIIPVPLTEEILEKNGFDYDEIYEEWNHKKCPLILFNPWNNDGAFVLSTYNSITFTYVHQLQHALRLCGITDLADNFKLQ